MPVWLGQQGIMMDTMERRDYGRRPRWDTIVTDELMPETAHNLSLVRTWLQRDLEGVGRQVPSPTEKRPGESILGRSPTKSAPKGPGSILA